MNYKIPFNKPFIAGNELKYIKEAVESGKISGDGFFTKKCHQFFREQYGFKKTLLTTSCTAALEMAAILIDIKSGDEVIVPSYTFVSTANAFVLRGAKIVFIDSLSTEPNMDVNQLEKCITSRTKAIVPVHYAGIACNMDSLMEMAKQHELYVVEDVAQAIDSYFIRKDGSKQPLGSYGQLSAFSFHETKNIIAGEGGMLVVNEDKFEHRAEIIREKGTNRTAFFKGEVDKYGWVDIGSSFLPSDIIAAFLYAQLEESDNIQNKRKKLWQLYFDNLSELQNRGILSLPKIPAYATNNAHMFYIVLQDLKTRDNLIAFLKKEGIYAVFHYQALHKSPFYINKHDGRQLPNADRYTDTLLRLPMYYQLSDSEVNIVTDRINAFFKGYSL